MTTQSAESYCQAHQIKLTPLRRHVLDILQKQRRPLTAYVILEHLKTFNPKAQVMSVYRVLDYLLANGLVHRLESLHAFIACSHLSTTHLSQWLICQSCGNTEEYIAPDFHDLIARLEEKSGFHVTSPTIELHGICQQCQKKSTAVDNT